MIERRHAPTFDGAQGVLGPAVDDTAVEHDVDVEPRGFCAFGRQVEHKLAVEERRHLHAAMPRGGEDQLLFFPQVGNEHAETNSRPAVGGMGAHSAASTSARTLTPFRYSSSTMCSSGVWS